MKFEKFKPVRDFNYSKGWDKFALDYVHLPNQNTVYSLTKTLMYEIIEKNIHFKNDDLVLDIGCGTGNDFPFFLEKNVKISAFDMSSGMLNKAHETFRDSIQSGKISLLKGRLEDFDLNSLHGEKYDLIFSITGGFSYIDNKLLLKVFKILKSMLKPGGRIITGHFNKFCLPEFLYYLSHWRFKSANQRNRDQLQVEIKNEMMTMHLRAVKDLKNIFADHFNSIKFYPLLAYTPPYQTGYNPGKRLLNFHKKFEQLFSDISLFAKIADQIIMVLENE